MTKSIVYQNKIDLIQQTITQDDIVLDVGFWGQGVKENDEYWPHKHIIARAKQVDGLDLGMDTAMLEKINPQGIYHAQSAEEFMFDRHYTKIFAGDIIEHLPNPGLFLDHCRMHLAPGGALIITTPNAFNLFVLAGKLMHQEPPVNKDHTCYFNSKTIACLLTKVGWSVEEYHYLYTLNITYSESYKKKFLNGLYRLLGHCTDKYMETLVVIARPHASIHHS